MREPPAPARQHDRGKDLTMAWLCLVAAGIFEIGWPLGLKLGWTDSGLRFWPLAGSILSMAASGILLLIAQRAIPIGTAYAVWTGLGAIGTFLVGIAVFREPATAARFVCVGLIAAGIIGFKLTGSEPLPHS
jgi:quaternary ammonium compound-resistance protein SugE